MLYGYIIIYTRHAQGNMVCVHTEILMMTRDVSKPSLRVHGVVISGSGGGILILLWAQPAEANTIEIFGGCCKGGASKVGIGECC